MRAFPNQRNRIAESKTASIRLGYGPAWRCLGGGEFGIQRAAADRENAMVYPIARLKNQHLGILSDLSTKYAGICKNIALHGESPRPTICGADGGAIT